MKNRKLLSGFYEVLSKKSGEHLEYAIAELRKARNIAHAKRLKKALSGFEEK